MVVDERVGESFSTTKNDIDWMMYGWSILHCLPVGMADKPSAETGTVMRPDTLRNYARAAGFDAVGFAPATGAPEAAGRLREFLASGMQGDMGWLEAKADRRASPGRA